VREIRTLGVMWRGLVIGFMVQPLGHSQKQRGETDGNLPRGRHPNFRVAEIPRTRGLATTENRKCQNLDGSVPTGINPREAISYRIGVVSSPYCI
jgi:hypothetical protein